MADEKTDKGKVYTPGSEPVEMTKADEQDLANALRGSLLILNTTSPDKRTIFRKLFTLLGIHEQEEGAQREEAGVNLHFTDSGSVNVVPTKTPEKRLSYGGNLDEKTIQQLELLLAPGAQEDIRKQLVKGYGLDPETVPIMGMTEDSGVSIIFEKPNPREGEPPIPDIATKEAFIRNVTEIISERIRERDHPWLVEHLKTLNNGDPRDSGFPGVNLHPLQNYLGGWPALLEVIYQAAEQAGAETLRFKNTSSVSFVNPETKKIYTKSFDSYGRVLTRQEYEQKLAKINGHIAVNMDFTQIYDQSTGENEEKTMDIMREDVLVSSEEKLQVDYPRRKIVSWLQDIVGKRPLPDNRYAPFDVGFISSDSRSGKKTHPVRTFVRGLRKVGIPTTQELLSNPHAKFFDDADAVVLIPSEYKKKPGELKHDPNMQLIMGAIVTAQTDPQSMCKPIILDNRTKKFAPILRIVQDAFLQGRLLGDLPFFVANTKSEMRQHLKEAQTMVRLSPKINKAEPKAELPAPKELPNDGIFTLFIGGGHENNSNRDLIEAFDLGYECAKNGYRIVTGAGSVEGSMGSLHTGFIRYHLDQIQNDKTAYAMDALLREIKKVPGQEYNINSVLDTVKRGNPDLKQALNTLEVGGVIAELTGKDVAASVAMLASKSWDIAQFKRRLDAYIPVRSGKYDAETIILEDPKLLNEIADAGFIPRDMFYGYSMKDLLKIENPTGDPPPAITYSDAGNITRRLKYLLQPGTKVFMPGSVGTDQELEDTIAQHLEARLRKARGVANDSFFADGTPDDGAAIIIYNREHSLDKVLKHYNIMDDNNETGEETHTERAMRENYNIVVVNTAEKLESAVLDRAENWCTPSQKIPAQRSV